jgi:hypothetical protein
VVLPKFRPWTFRNRTTFPVRASSRHLACGPRGRALKGQCGRITAGVGATHPNPPAATFGTSPGGRGALTESELGVRQRPCTMGDEFVHLSK